MGFRECVNSNIIFELVFKGGLVSLLFGKLMFCYYLERNLPTADMGNVSEVMSCVLTNSPRLTR